MEQKDMTTLSNQLDYHLARMTRATTRWHEERRHQRLFSKPVAAVDFLARAGFHLWRNRRYYTLIKLANMGMINLQFKLKTKRVWGRPYKMKIESTNICNTKCQLCPTGIGLQGRAKGKMSLDQYQQLIDRFRWHLQSVDLSMWGDPLIVPDIYDMIRYAHDRRIWTYISSNLHAFKLDPKPGRKSQAEQLVESGLDMLTCSLHGATQATYEIYQPGKRLDECIEKIRRIIHTRDRMGSKTPEVQLNFVVTRHNEHERDAFKALARELNCKAVFSTASMNVRFLDKDQKLQPLGLAQDVREKKIRNHLNNWLPKDQAFVLEPYRKLAETGRQRDEIYNGKKDFDCSWPWKQCVINWDGQVVTCCGSFDPAEDMGNALQKPFASIWNGKRYRMARRSFTKRVDAEAARDNPCATCPGYML